MFKILFILGLALIFPFIANADMGADCDKKYPYDATYYKNFLEAGNAAECYAEKENAIGMIMGYGTGNTVSPEAMGNKFVKELATRNQKSKYFVAPRDSEGITLSYVFGNNVNDLGPQGIRVAARKMSEAVSKKQALDRLLLKIQK
jgi:hypothetical protein